MSPSTVLLALVLAVAVLTASIGALALWRLPAALDRLHAVAFLNASVGPLLVVAGLLTEGITPRTLKLAAIALVLLLSGAALSHATGRALLIRDGRKA